MKFRDRYFLIKNLSELVEEMNKELKFVIVEGKNDKEVLRMLGFKRKIFLVNKKAKIKGKYTILTDFDKEGEYLARVLSKEYGEKYLANIYREKFFCLLKSCGIREIQAVKKSIKMLRRVDLILF
ncbi:MAG: hypothetical protein QXD89_02390 [Candidatus Aenigmatarchaeota archaeon]